MPDWLLHRCWTVNPSRVKPGSQSLDAPGTFEQQRWLAQQLTDAPTDRWLIVAVHHAPYSLDTTHGGYADIGDAVDRAFNTTNRTPDLVLSGHVHNYQRFTRAIGDKKISYVVAGAGGYADSERAMHKIAKEITVPFQTSLPDVMLAAYNDTEPGFLRLKVTKATIACEYYTIDFQDNPQGVRDSFTVPLTDQPSPTASRDTTPKQRHRRT